MDSKSFIILNIFEPFIFVRIMVSKNGVSAAISFLVKIVPALYSLFPLITPLFTTAISKLTYSLLSLQEFYLYQALPLLFLSLHLKTYQFCFHNTTKVFSHNHLLYNLIKSLFTCNFYFIIIFFNINNSYFIRLKKKDIFFFCYIFFINNMLIF